MSESLFIDEEDLFLGLPQPFENGLTIYGKINCPNCEVLKDELAEHDISCFYIACDIYLLSNKERFKRIMFRYMDRKYVENDKNLLYFPIVFNNGRHVNELKIIDNY